MDSSTPTPKSILRGHKSQIHAAAFIRSNERLITGDADGFVVLWDLTIMRPRAVWRAHEKALLGVRGWGDDKVITHGRDMKLIVWKLGEADEDHLSTALPVEDVPTPRAQPWVLHLLEVNTLNFCAFAICSSVPGPVDTASEVLIAVPNTLNSDAVDIYHLPSQHRIHTIKAGDKTGMAMCLALLHHNDVLTLIAAFENGYATVQRLEADGQWTTTYNSQAHSQPVLSLSVCNDFFITSSADSIVAKHPIPTQLFFPLEDTELPKSTERVVEIIDEDPKGKSLLSAGLRSSSAQTSTGAPKKGVAWKDPLKAINTKHSGQQSLDIRSDGRIFATAGWDSKVRVYSTKTMKELAVLKWHQVGCYAVAFADVKISDKVKDDTSTTGEENNKTSTALSTRTTSVVRTGLSVKEQRIATARQTHWIAAGAKDGKISLWDIY
ncbi:WD40-repeat-containing domain protein [Fusarium flagelliforme]|uniref:WD40-repeat-containing domain protein n=1 Tax=Fusarium flagelliforme TaxID=2675880 RepID=UPI001E8CD4EA|nr:WD40-repeat-containing domain protein [Fusarium flagelliforme]KAH7173537.1 WD40-repeat-containing domain protein [Fusarium flagelliforme]